MRRPYLKLVANPRDELSFKRLAQLLPGIAAKGADKVMEDFSAKMRRWGSPDESLETSEQQTSDSNAEGARARQQPPVAAAMRDYKIARRLQGCVRSGKGGDGLGAIHRDDCAA
jgi:hypothetical protein